MEDEKINVENADFDTDGIDEETKKDLENNK